MDYSIIMQSKNPDKQKMIRAINSVLGQQCKCIFELIIICDNCQKTWDIVSNDFRSELEFGLKLRLLKRSDEEVKKGWRSVCRNDGINAAKGNYILYIDNDDYFTNNYLKQISAHIDHSKDWFLVDDLIFDKNKWIERRANLVMGKCGTANVIHKRTMHSRWPEKTMYGRDDWQFINNLHSESKRFAHLNISGYCVCHIPNRYCI